MPRINVEKLLLEIEIDKVAERLGMALKSESATRKLTLCPFHDDKTPSLLIDTGRDNSGQHYHCFACGEHGDAIDLVKGVLHTDFKGALEWLLPNSNTAPVNRARKQNAMQPEQPEGSGLTQAYKLYQLSNDKQRLANWVSDRKLDIALMENAGFIYAHKNSLSKHVSSRKDFGTKRELAATLEEANLIRKILPTSGFQTYHLNLQSNNDNSYIDFFAGDRIVFPIRDDQKKVLGLAARAVDEQPAKYLFSKNFQKSKAIFRIEQATTTLRGLVKRGETDLRLYICEGFFDALRLESLGFSAVAVMGASISKEQIQIIKGLSDTLPSKLASLTICICFDRDEAGLRGASEAVLKFLGANLDVQFIWPTTAQLISADHSNTSIKDPDEYLRDLSVQQAKSLIEVSTYGPGVAVLANQFGVHADELLENPKWNSASRSRKYRSFEKTRAELRKVVGNPYLRLNELFVNSRTDFDSAAQIEWIDFLSVDIATEAAPSECYLTNSGTRLNHARLLAYMGSRRGELPCEESKWERLDIAASAFNVLLVERLASEIHGSIDPFEAVWVPRSFGAEEPRLKVMPQPEDLIAHQYLLNELLTERWDASALGVTAFSQCIPAVRYYREERKTVTTGISTPSDNTQPIIIEQTLSFAYQIDMEVIEGRQPASDQGMFRPFLDCWRDFMQSLKNQAKSINYVHVIRLDVSRYYDRIRRHVVRDSIQPFIQQALETVADNAPAFAELMKIQASADEAADKSAIIVEQLCDMLFGYPYLSPDNGRINKSDPLRGIPQGPVTSAWLGSVALFPVDLAALEMMNKYNVDGETHLGYARYVDDIVLLASSSVLLEELRELVDQKTRSLDLALVAKADAIPPMSAEEFADYANQGRALEASGPAWEPPLAGDGEAGWEFWSGTPPSDRQSALQLLSNWEIYKSPIEIILQTVKTSFLAMDLRSSELAKGARLIWYVVASDLLSADIDPSDAADLAWELYDRYWNECTEECGWQLNPDSFGWEAPNLFALEGLEKLIDHKNSLQSGLTASENALRHKRISFLARTVLGERFKLHALESGSTLKHQIDKRLDLLEWKASKSCGMPVRRTKSYAERSMYIRSWQPFNWFHAAVEDFMLADQSSGSDPLSSYVTQFQSIEKSIRPNHAASYEFFRYLLPSDGSDSDLEFFSKTENRYSGLAIQILVALVPRESIIQILSNRARLLCPLEAGKKLLVMPPLPGVNQQRIVACQIDSSSENKIKKISSFECYEIDSTKTNTTSLDFFGANSAGVVVLTPTWNTEAQPQSAILRSTSEVPKNLVLEVFEKPSTGFPSAIQGLKHVASLYRAIVVIMAEYERQNDGLELIPAWPYLATDMTSGNCYLICEGVTKGEVGNRAFVRDGGRALRTIEIPIYEAQLWRAGVALSDYMGLHDDIAKFSSSESEIPLDATTLAAPSQYVLRSQLRKLRGAFANSQIGRRVMPPSFLPASVERALELLEHFPEDSDSTKMQLMHLLATETETAGMRVRYEKNIEVTELTVFLRAVADRVLTKLPLSIGEVIAAPTTAVSGLRRDLSGVLTLARSIWSMDEEEKLSPIFAWKIFRAGIVGIGIAVALRGIIASLRSHGGFARFEGFDFPAEWELPPATAVLSEPATTDKTTDENVSLLDHFRVLVSHLGHRMRLDDNGEPQIPEEISTEIREYATALAGLTTKDSTAVDASDWPFFDISEKVFDTLNIELLENVSNLIKNLDSALGLQVILVTQQSYGFNAQTKRFTDSRGLAWDIKPWMISQYPLRARHVEECFDQDRRIVRVWSEIYEKNSQRLLSISVLGEPFASIALCKDLESLYAETKNADSKQNTVSGPSEQGSESAPIDISPILETVEPVESIEPVEPVKPVEPVEPVEPEAETALADTQLIPTPNQTSTEDSLDKIDTERNTTHNKKLPLTDATLNARKNSFRNSQLTAWSDRKSNKNPAHVRVALFQWDQELSYAHPMVEATPQKWPFSSGCKPAVLKELKGLYNSPYQALLNATESAGQHHLWKNENIYLPSWGELRRRRLLLNAVNACQSFGVDLLILPEYSVRAETVKWLKEECLPGKTVAVLAGTFLAFDSGLPPLKQSASLNLLWPVPRDIAECLKPLAPKTNEDAMSLSDKIDKGIVLQWGRSKKYRSVALNEFIRPGTDPLTPLFMPGKIIDELRRANWDLDADGVVKLLANTELPLANFMELICSEIFLFTSPTNIPEMARDYVSMCARFGFGAAEAQVWADLKLLSKWLSVCSKPGGADSRRSILIVPAATTRTADYWIAGQAGLLAAGTTTVFINGVGSGLKGGSCFIGRESWKTGASSHGYIETITPYHGWSKGIYYNSKHDPLSEIDQALVIADIDPHNMLEGKPRPQMLPVPLQLVAYLPIVETVDEASLDQTLCDAVQVDHNNIARINQGQRLGGRLKSRNEFWQLITQSINNDIDNDFIINFSKYFTDGKAILERANSFFNNGHQQPFSSVVKLDLLCSPALYDWLEADMTLREGEALPNISVPSWTK